ncbi:DDE-type integrase/transposase/recombinase [Leisingera sp.]|uniref:DDE-type integrase/transposase/recombinase n=1 Tax=Leisingera sp. TaxID=1879318 RepID=UPI002B26F62C|nr:DDE-type integrase/transposase/recombinase [Leisingera sp.]
MGLPLSSGQRGWGVVDLKFSEHRDAAAAATFFARNIQSNGWPGRAVIGRSRATLASLARMNFLLILKHWCWLVEMLQVQYLNNTAV